MNALIRFNKFIIFHASENRHVVVVVVIAVQEEG